MLFCFAAAMSSSNILLTLYWAKLIHGLIAKIQVAVGCVVHLRTLHIAKNLLKEENEELFAMIKVVYWILFTPQNKLSPHLLRWPCEGQLNNAEPVIWKVRF